MRRRPDVLAFSIVTVLITFPLLMGGDEFSVLTQYYDNGRSGVNPRETQLSTSNVNANQFGKLFSRTVDGQIYAQPLYVSNLSIPNKGLRNLVYVATMKNKVYAFDADDPSDSDPLWQKDLGSGVPWQDTGALAPDINGEIGITGTPVIDASTETIYLVAKTKDSNTYVQYLHALDIVTGAPRPYSPVVIEASVPGSGDSSIGGRVSFNPLKQLNRSGLLLLNGTLYIPFGAHADSDPYHGWILGYNAATLQQVAVFNVTPNGGRAGIWQAGAGLVADDRGYIYVMTGNGTFNYHIGGKDLGDSFVKLDSAKALSVVDWFTPYNQDYINERDLDLGSSRPLLLPGTDLMIGGGKEGTLYLLNAQNMGHFQTGSDSQIVQSFRATAGLIYGSPIYWNTPESGPMIYLWPANDSLKAFRFVNGFMQTTPFAKSAKAIPIPLPGAILSLSADGNKAGSGILWAYHPFNASAHHSSVAGVLRAFDASDISKELWNSQQDVICDDPGKFAKFVPPIVANGKVYLATFSNQLVVYGLQKSSQRSPTFTSAVFSTTGLSNSLFTSEMTLGNRGSTNAALDFTYTAAFGGGSASSSVTLPAGQQIIPDAIAYLKSIGIPIPDSGDRGGTLAVRFTGLESCCEGAVAIRTTTPVPNGRVGSAYAAVPTTMALTETAYLCGLRQNFRDRSNVAIQNLGMPSDGDITLRLTIFSGEAEAPVEHALPDQKLSPGGFLQFSGILHSSGLSLANGYVRIQRTGGTAPYYAYAVINDQITSDGSFVPPVLGDALAGRPGLILPVIVETSSFTSELIITNWSNTAKTIRFAFVADAIQAEESTADFIVVLRPGEQKILENIVQVMRDQGVSGIPRGLAYVGSLFATVDTEDANGVFIAARTTSLVDGGRHGLFYAGIPYGTASTNSTWLWGLQQNAENRSNLALVNTGEVDENPNLFSIDLFDGNTGRKVTTIEGIRVNPKRWMQINSILAQFAPGTSQGYVQIRRTAGSNPFIAYAIVHDGAQPGQRSGDASYLSSFP